MWFLPKVSNGILVQNESDFGVVAIDKKKALE
jgi:hypothetical protein